MVNTKQFFIIYIIHSTTNCNTLIAFVKNFVYIIVLLLHFIQKERRS
ncbi:MAG: hypothetical protein K0S67_1497 [Nitrososphaeraceae archaeon]|jgi:hypothetical protein|nr:hypothetical protein [Nitrososphaeraceae archaeon]